MSYYHATSKFLHHLALNYPSITELTFDLECSLYANSTPCAVSANHVFVTGLARAGTTILMREIYSTNQFASLTYRNMPLVLCPNVWRPIAQRFSTISIARERAHNDGIVIDLDSPEALDEVFWRVFSMSAYITKDGLIPYTPKNDVLKDFTKYVALILRSQKKSRYLSKNNNNLLRLPALHTLFPKAIFLVPVRNPLDHAQSLLNQHRQFSSSSYFTQKYMTWLAHHEFGKTHVPFLLGEANDDYADPLTLEYWLERWLDCYQYLSRFSHNDFDRVYFICYEDLCDNPKVWIRVTELIDHAPKEEAVFQRAGSMERESTATPLLKKTKAVYDVLRAASLKKIHLAE